MSDDKTFKHESLQDPASVLAYLDALREGLAKGALVLTTKEKELVLQLKGLIRFDIEAKRKDSQRKLTLKLTWKDCDEPMDDAEDLSIEARPVDAQR
ncbi:amphi-Trp domain-containing protein [Megalodesulfovibrio paquesii]